MVESGSFMKTVLEKGLVIDRKEKKVSRLFSLMMIPALQQTLCGSIVSIEASYCRQRAQLAAIRGNLSAFHVIIRLKIYSLSLYQGLSFQAALSSVLD